MLVKELFEEQIERLFRLLELVKGLLSATRADYRVRDMDDVGLITAEIASQLSPDLLTRFEQIRSTE
jgi:hypothetical protein